MKKSEKILAVAVVGILGSAFLGFGLKRFFTAPLKKIDTETAALREKIAKANAKRKEFFTAEDYLKGVTQRTFADKADQASAKSGEMVNTQIALAGLNEADFTRLPVGPRRMRGAQEIGWSVQGKGTLDKIVNLVFLLDKSPQAHRLENLTLTAHDKPGEVRVGFRYFTIVVDPAPAVAPLALKPKFTLESPERKSYDMVMDRDILRPYIKRPPAPPAAPAAPSAAPAAPGLESFKVVSLTEWQGEAEVHVRDLSKNKTAQYKAGDTLSGGQIVAVDYRRMPSPKNPEIASDSRVILKIGQEFWAIERGQTLAEKRKLEPEQWPGPDGK